MNNKTFLGIERRTWRIIIWIIIFLGILSTVSCCNDNDNSYDGGRSIAVSERWSTKGVFINDQTFKISDEYTIKIYPGLNDLYVLFIDGDSTSMNYYHRAGNNKYSMINRLQYRFEEYCKQFYESSLVVMTKKKD
jgi:hypothetical protein